MKGFYYEKMDVYKAAIEFVAIVDCTFATKRVDAHEDGWGKKLIGHGHESLAGHGGVRDSQAPGFTDRVRFFAGAI